MPSVLARIAFAMALAVLAGCASEPGPAGGLQASGPLRVGMAPNYPPVAFAESGVLTGLEADLARELERRTGRSFDLEAMAWENLIPALEAGAIDVIMAGMSITPERRQRVAFTAPYLRVGQMALIRERDAARLAAPDALRRPGARIGVVGGTTGDAFVSSQLLRAIVFRFGDTPAGVQALLAGQVDFFVHDAPTVWHFAAAPDSRRQGLMGLFTPLTEEYLAWAVRKDDPALKRQLDAALEQMRDDGTLQRIVGRWITTSVEVGPTR